MSSTQIVDIKAREILDSRGNPTVEVNIWNALDKKLRLQKAFPCEEEEGDGDEGDEEAGEP